MMAARQLRAGNLILFENDLYRVLSVVHHTPGNLRAKVQVEMRNIKNGVKRDHRFRADEDVEKASLNEREMEYLYNEGDNFIFMDSKNYEQIYLTKDDLGNAVHYIQPNLKVQVALYEERPVGVEIPSTMILAITDTQPPLRGATASGSAKPATLENGLTVKVPQFIEVGDKVKVDTSTNEYMERC